MLLSILAKKSLIIVIYQLFIKYK